ncbi:extracellular solute-binding protein [Paenibacillus eucommiae]|uniref:Multiple sugar transport system substrate-binding protein n=1 Tax=Paenibacillus eucommiae TaxID=1355755 RepID=A0ABS4ILK0_9BACL|nr:extracellular solute-binding protein [Paenibacillus eucommiae]MBP1988414.1 multiple sugar transport system substrate-binding protein [Paenibacillus eucommiae]
MRRESEFRYSKLANMLREQILSGYIKPGQFLLSENELCKHYNLSRTSVRKSLDQLQQEGLIVKKVGQGTTVALDLVIPENYRKVLRIFAAAPSFFANQCMDLIIQAFQSKYPHVEVKLYNFPAQDFWGYVRSNSENGLKPDIIFTADRHCFEAEGEEKFIDLKVPLADSLALLYPRLVDAFHRNDEMLAVPVTFSTIYLVYNPDLFDKYGIAQPELGWSKADFLRAARELTLDTNGDGILDQYGFSISTGLNRWPVFALQNGFSFKEPVKLEAIEKTLNFMHDLLYRERIAIMNPRTQVESEAFVYGKAGMLLTNSVELAGWGKEKLQFEPKVASLPFGENQSTLMLASVFMVPADGGAVDWALRFLETALSKEVQEEISKDAGYLSVLSSVNEEKWDRLTLESLNIVEDRIENSLFLNEMYDDPKVLEELEAAMVLYWCGLESAEAAAQGIARVIKN